MILVHDHTQKNIYVINQSKHSIYYCCYGYKKKAFATIFLISKDSGTNCSFMQVIFLIYAYFSCR